MTPTLEDHARAELAKTLNQAYIQAAVLAEAFGALYQGLADDIAALRDRVTQP